MRADYHQLPRRATKTLEDNYGRVKLIMNEQEVCSTLHGIAKMNAGWLTVGDEVGTMDGMDGMDGWMDKP